MTAITSNAQAINEAESMQARSREAMKRIQRQTEETQEVASLTLDELRQQGRQLQVIELQSHSIEAQLKQTDKLLNSYDRWAFKLRGKKQAKKEAKGVLAGAKARQATKSLSKGVDPAVASIKNQVVSQKRPERKKEVLIKSTYEHAEDRNPMMNEEDKAGLYRIDQNDKELDEMLDEIGSSIDGIASLCLAMKEETDFQAETLESVGKVVERSNEKQAVAVTRVRSNLTGRWRRTYK